MPALRLRVRPPLSGSDQTSRWRSLGHSPRIDPHKDPRRPALPWLTSIAGGLVLAVSFGIALWLIAPEQPPMTPAMTVLVRSTISDLGGLMAAVKAAGLKGSPDIKGTIEDTLRLDSDHVSLKGWAADIAGRDPSLAIMAFVDGRHRLTMQTSGKRPDIAAALGLSDAASASLSFAHDLTCSRGQRLILVAVAPSGLYGHFGARRCP